MLRTTSLKVLLRWDVAACCAGGLAERCFHVIGRSKTHVALLELRSSLPEHLESAYGR